MIIPYNPDDYYIESNNNICKYHKEHPYDQSYPGCMCSMSISLRKKDFNQIKEDIYKEHDELFKELVSK